MPPFTLIAWPVIFAAPGPARNTAIGAISAGVTTPSRARFSAFSNSLRLNSSDITLSYATVSRTIEGVRACTRIPCREFSRAKVFENITVPALQAPIIASPGVAIFAASEDILMMTPPSRAIINGIAAGVEGANQMGLNKCFKRLYWDLMKGTGRKGSANAINKNIEAPESLFGLCH
jgi:hypothetical protein